MEEREIVLISNVRSQDSLSNFCNPLPKHTFNEFYNHEIAVSGFGLSCKLKNNATPRHTNLPVMITAFRKTLKRVFNIEDKSELVSKNLDLKLLTMENPGYYINVSENYTPEKLSSHFNQLAVMHKKKMNFDYKGIPTSYNQEKSTIEFSQFHYDMDKFIYNSAKRLHELFFFFHERFVESLSLLLNNTDWVTIGGEKYYFYHPKSAQELLSSKKSIVVKFPKVIHICSNTVQSTLFDDEYKPILRRTALPIKDGKIGVDGHFSFSFKNLEYVPAISKVLNFIHIQFLDENHQQLKLSQGFPSYVTLRIRSTSDFT